MPKPTAIVRAVPSTYDQCLVTHIGREPIDVARARRQHAAYCAALRKAGCRVIKLPADTRLPDSCFVEDTAIVLDEIAIITRPGAAERRPEIEQVTKTLKTFRPLHHLKRPASLDGGDVLHLGRTLYVGRSTRTNEAAISQLRKIVRPFGYKVVKVPVRGALHLKTVISEASPGTLLARTTPKLQPYFPNQKIKTVPADEAPYANVLRIGDQVILAKGSHRTRQELVDMGVNVLEVEIGEFLKGEAGVTCLSLIIDAPA